MTTIHPKLAWWAVAAVALLLPGGVRASSERLVIHEWGTFTVLQDEQGRAIGGINTDDEPVPGFVHDIAGITPGEHGLPSSRSAFSKGGVPRSHPDVYVRLETPVLYFYPAPGTADQSLDVDVSFRGGWLSQFYPDAKPGGANLSERGSLQHGHLTDDTVGSLAWSGLKLGGEWPGPATNDKVWVAPRAVSAAAVSTPKGEHERFLFYRGVGHVAAPLRVLRKGDQLLVRAEAAGAKQVFRGGYGPLVLVDARADGTSAFRTVDGNDLYGSDSSFGAAMPAEFEPADYSADNLARLRGVLHEALVRQGLFDDEAEAMLNTWEVSYFKRPGLRMFFMVPREWTENVLPLHVSRSADITRVMVGRIELVTPRQREALKIIAAGPASKPNWMDAVRAVAGIKTGEVEALAALAEDPAVPFPGDYRAYLKLGRFRDALVNDERLNRPTEALSRFVAYYELEPYAFPPASASR